MAAPMESDFQHLIQILQQNQEANIEQAIAALREDYGADHLVTTTYVQWPIWPGVTKEGGSSGISRVQHWLLMN